VTAVIIPADVQELEYEAPEHAFKMVPSSKGLSRFAPIPDDEDLQRAADILNAGEKVAILVGQGARGADRHRPVDDRPALPLRGEPGR
jgi:pyruvate dehydrogenase (quinone)